LFEEQKLEDGKKIIKKLIKKNCTSPFLQWMLFICFQRQKTKKEKKER
jgi:hypothetical protein